MGVTQQDITIAKGYGLAVEYLQRVLATDEAQYYHDLGIIVSAATAEIKTRRLGVITQLLSVLKRREWSQNNEATYALASSIIRGGAPALTIPWLAETKPYVEIYGSDTGSIANVVRLLTQAKGPSAVPSLAGAAHYLEGFLRQAEEVDRILE